MSKYGRIDIPAPEIQHELDALKDNVRKGIVSQEDADREAKALKRGVLLFIAATNAMGPGQKMPRLAGRPKRKR